MPVLPPVLTPVSPAEPSLVAVEDEQADIDTSAANPMSRLDLLLTFCDVSIITIPKPSIITGIEKLTGNFGQFRIA